MNKALYKVSTLVFDLGTMGSLTELRIAAPLFQLVIFYYITLYYIILYYIILYYIILHYTILYYIIRRAPPAGGTWSLNGRL